MGQILKTELDYDSVRGALGLDHDVRRQLTDEVIDELQFLPSAEAEAISRVSKANFQILMGLAPNDPDQTSFKAGTIALCCANLCSRLEITIPVEQQIEDLARVKRIQINWKQKKADFRSDANYFFANISTEYYARTFPVALAHARGRVLPHDPDFQRSFPNQEVSNFTGYTAPSGAYYAISVV